AYSMPRSTAVLSGAWLAIDRSGAISVPTLMSEYWTRTSTDPRSTSGRGTRATTAPPLFRRIWRIKSDDPQVAEHMRSLDRQRGRALPDHDGRGHFDA